MKITAADVRRLLHSGERDAVLVLLEGRPEVVSARHLESGPYQGALWVTSRDEVVAAAGRDDPSERELEEHAAHLDAAVSNLGG